MTSVLVLSQRGQKNGLCRVPGYTAFLEAEQVLVDTALADLAVIQRGGGTTSLRLRRIIGRTWRRTFGSNQALPRFPMVPDVGVEIGRTRNRYDLAVFVAYTIWDLPMLERLKIARRHAHQVVAGFPELWISDLDDRRALLEPFDLLDHIFVGMPESTRVLGRLLDRKVHYLPMAVDTERFAAIDASAQRPIDVLGIGRRRPDLHEALIVWAEKSSRHYLYDTAPGSLVSDFQTHRENLAGTYRNTSLAITHYAKFDLPEVIGTQREIPGRLWEGLAAGALMVGQPPQPELQRDCLGREVVWELPKDPGSAVDLIDDLLRLDHQQERSNNVRLALEGNDWGHRWSTVFDTSGIARPVGLEQRLDRLTDLASMVR